MSVRVLPMLGTWQRKRRGSTPLSRDRHESAYALQLPELLVMLAFRLMFGLTQEGQLDRWGDWSVMLIV